MTKIIIPTKTSAEIDTVFDAIFHDVVPPAPPKPVTVLDQLAPYRRAIMKQRRRGLTWDQIVAGMADARLGAKVTARALKRAFAAPRKGAAPTNPKTTPSALSPTKAAANSPSSSAPAAYIPPPRLVLDPVTRRPVK